jgi:hypothetical protein
MPRPFPSDAEGVTRALETADALWRRDDRRDALIWLSRAIECARAAAQHQRAADLAAAFHKLSRIESSRPTAPPAASTGVVHIEIPRHDPPPLPHHVPGGLDWGPIAALADLPEAAKRALARAVAIERLDAEEEVANFGLAIVLDGDVAVAPTIVDAFAERLDTGSVVLGFGTLAHANPLRLVAVNGAAKVAVWDEPTSRRLLSEFPAVERRLKLTADRRQALVGALMGPLGERFDEATRHEVVAQLALRYLASGTVFAEANAELPGLLLMGAGSVEVADEEPRYLSPGEFLFPRLIVSPGPCPSRVVAGEGGALALVADRATTQALILSVPTLLELLAEIGQS